MEKAAVIVAIAALAHETRLDTFQLLVAHESDRLPG
jgi:hypothetical protein